MLHDSILFSFLAAYTLPTSQVVDFVAKAPIVRHVAVNNHLARAFHCCVHVYMHRPSEERYQKLVCCTFGWLTVGSHIQLLPRGCLWVNHVSVSLTNDNDNDYDSYDISIYRLHTAHCRPATCAMCNHWWYTVALLIITVTVTRLLLVYKCDQYLHMRVEQKVHERGFLCVSLWVCN